MASSLGVLGAPAHLLLSSPYHATFPSSSLGPYLRPPRSHHHTELARLSGASCSRRRAVLSVQCSSTLPTADKSAIAATTAQMPVAAVAAALPLPTACVPEDMQLVPGDLSPIDRVGKGLDVDVFRCFGCIKDECKVRCPGHWCVAQWLHIRRAGPRWLYICEL